MKLLVTFMTIMVLTTSAFAEGRPAGCPRGVWCGCYLRLKLGIHDARLNLALNWATFGHRSNAVADAIVVWRHHVGQIVRLTRPGYAIVHSGNDGGGQVRTRERSITGAIAFRVP